MMSSGEESNREEELAIVNLENVKRISETYKPKKGKGKSKKGTIPKAVVQEIWKDRLSPRFYSRLTSVMFPEESNEVSFLSFYTIYKNLAEQETEIMFRALTIYHIATIHEPPFNYEQANEYPNASYKAIKDYVCDVITSYLHAIIHFNMKEAHAWLDLRASNTLIDGNLVASYILKDLETHRNEVSIGSLEIWLEKNEIYYTVSEQLYLYLFGVNSQANVKPLIPFPVVQTGRTTKTLLALPDVLLLNSKLPKRAQRWTLAYMLDSRSQNWETLKQAIYGKSQTIIVIQDANGDIFGMYGSQRWFPSEGFFGNDKCFLFTLKPDVNVYEGSGRDNNFQLFTESGIGMGGTADRMGLFIQRNTQKGLTSLACSTFREFWPLARESEFKITQIEIWTVDDEQPQAVVEQDVGKLISNTQYMRMKCDQMYNETKTLVQPKSQQPRAEHDPVIDGTSQVPTMPMCRPLRCCGECAKHSQSENDAKYNPGRVCCSKRCTRKTRVCISPNNPLGGDGNAKVHTVQRYPRQEEERRQCQHIHSEDKVTIKRETRCQRISFDARQKSHGGSGFIHPSLAAEENARNANLAKEAQETKDVKETRAASLSSIKSRSKKSKTSKKQKSPLERDLSQTTYSPTYTHTQTQVGESRLMKRTCKSYKHENECACVVKKSCACTPTETILPLSGKSETMYIIKTAHTNYTKNKMITEETMQGNERKPNKTNHQAKANHNLTSETDPVRSYIHQSSPAKDMPADSSSTVLIEFNNSNIDASNALGASSRCNLTASETSTQDIKSKDPSRMENEKLAKNCDMKSLLMKSKANSKHTGKEKGCEGKAKQEDKSHNTNGQKILTFPVKNIEEANEVTLEDLIPAELDCHCSSSTDCNDAEGGLKKYEPASKCCCETKVSNYLTKMSRTDITGVELSEISSSVCSCILDNKNRITAPSTGISANSSGKETQNLTKSRRSCGSTRSVPVPNILTENVNKSRKISAWSPNYSLASKKETQLLTKPRRMSRTSASSAAHSNERPQPFPPICVRCKTLVGQHGCQCKVKSIRNNHATPTQQTSHLVQKELGWNPLALKNGGSIQPVALDTEATSFVPGGEKMEQGAASISEISTPSGNINRVSSQSSQMIQAPKKSCKTSCKCSLSPSYFPIFPEDLINEGGTEENCGCASNNELRFPIIVETLPNPSTEPNTSSQTRMEPDQANEHEEEEDRAEEEETKDKKCGCDDDDNTIIIMNVSKCNTAGTVEKIIEELEVKAGDASNPNVKSLVFKCKDLASTMRYTHSPCTTKGGPEQEALRQHVERILRRKTPTRTQREPEKDEPQE